MKARCFSAAVFAILWVTVLIIGGCADSGEDPDCSSDNPPEESTDTPGDSDNPPTNTAAPPYGLSTGGIVGWVDVPPQCEYDFSRVTTILENYAAQSGLGAGFAIVTKDEFLYEEYFGDFTAVTSDNLASASKIPSTTAFMTLVSQGLVGLDDPVDQYIDFWPARKNEVTVRQCLSHTTGFAALSLPQIWPFYTLEQSVRGIAEQVPLFADPGTAFYYGGNGLQIAGYIAELLTGMEWRQFFEHSLGQHLDLTSFGYGNYPNPLVGTAANSNTRDYAKLLQLHLARGQYDEKVLISEELIAEMQVDQIADIAGPDEYGLGWWIMTHEPFEPPTRFHDGGGSGATPWIDMKRGYGAFLLIRDVYYMGYRLQNQLLPVLEAQFDKCR
jgi:CubicO group peptidase (beta-lactamase class C family)